MQSKTSFFNKTVFKKNLSRTWVVGAFYLIVLLVTMPLNMILTCTNSNNLDPASGYTAGYYFLNLLSIEDHVILPAILSIVTMMLIFNYLFVKRDTYMMHSFPVSRNSLFFSGVIAAMVVEIAPILINAVITTVVAAALNTGYISAIWYWTFMEICVCLFFIGFSMFCMMLTGQAITAVVFYGILNFVYMGMEFTFRVILGSLSFGLGSMVNDLQITPMTPIVYIYENCGVGFDVKWDDNYEKMLELVATLKGTPQLIGYLVAGVVFSIFAFLLYKYKKLETVNDFITVKAVKPIFSVGITFFVSAMLGVMIESGLAINLTFSYSMAFVVAIIATLIMGVIVFYITLMLIARTVRVFKKSNAKYCLIYSIGALVIMLGIRVDVFGITTYVPDASEIEWVGIDGGIRPIVLSRPEDINEVMSIHSELLDDSKEIREIKYTANSAREIGRTITFKYKLTNGKTVTRDYYLENSEAADYSEKYVAFEDHFLGFMNDTDIIKEHILGPFYDDCTITEVDFGIAHESTEYGGYETEYKDVQFASVGDKINANQEIYEAVIKDIEAGNLLTMDLNSQTKDSDLYNDFSITMKSNRGKCMLDENIMYDWNEASDENYVYITLNRNCINTLEKLKEYGYYDSDDELIDNSEVWPDGLG